MSISSSAPWLKYYGDTPQHLKYPQKTIYEMVKAAADKYPKNYAYEFMGKKTTYAEFMQKIDAAAKAYLALGIQKGDRVTICMPNCPQAVDSFYALNRIGAVSNMIHPLSAAGEIKFYLNFSKSMAILTLDQFYGKIAPIMPELDDPDTKMIIAKIEDELFPHLALGYALTAGRKYPHPERKGNYIWWKDFLRKGKKLNAYLPKNAQKPEDGASILYSGGTTGTTEELDANFEGEICISGPSVMLRYVDNPEETANTLRRHEDGRIWLHTGDLGKMDEDGFVYFSQRIKRMIITSGYNVYPGQLENIIDGHEKVLLSCVIGVKDPYKMQKVKAFVVLRPGYEPSDAVKQDILDYCRQHIAKYAMPYDIEFRPELPKTLVGKVAYRVLEEEEAERQAAEDAKNQ